MEVSICSSSVMNACWLSAAGGLGISDLTIVGNRIAVFADRAMELSLSQPLRYITGNAATCSAC